jgi:hypothetical protein
MALINGKVSQTIWYGLAFASAFWGLTLYKPRYCVCFAKVESL